MDKMELMAPCHFGLEAVLKREIGQIGYDISKVEDGRVTFLGNQEAVARANIFLRSTERILLKVGEFKALTFEQLFEETRKLPWENWIPEDGKFWVAKASSIKSKLFSPSDIQSIMKKAIVDRLKKHYRTNWFKESGAFYPIRVFFYKDHVTVGLDTSGDSLHKRGYRLAQSRAPISETLACGLIQLTPWKRDRILVDPFCGSGTFVIEAAMMGANLAPGRNRHFLAEKWDNLMESRCWEEAFSEAKELCDLSAKMEIQGYDIDGKVVKSARENARRAGVEHLVHFQQRPVKELHHPKKYGFIITNPPYGERMEEKAELPALYREMGQAFAGLDSWSEYVVTAYEDAEKYIGRKADKNRKIYNGMMKAYYYQFLGPKPPKRKRCEERYKHEK